MTADTAASPPPTPTARRPTAHGSGGIGNPVLGMLLFITSEVMFFAGLFAAYFSLRASFIDSDGVKRWPPPGVRATSSTRSRCGPRTGTLNLILPATIILIISSFTCQFGV